MNETCSCQCTLKESDCPANSTFDAASCSCGCPLTNADCTNQFNDEDFVVSPDPTLCGCVCSSKVEAACQALGRFWQTSSESCGRPSSLSYYSFPRPIPLIHERTLPPCRLLLCCNRCTL